jgi:hypothetical protein
MPYIRLILSQIDFESGNVAGSCYSNALQNGHPCVENAMHQNCPVCVEVSRNPFIKFKNILFF